ncbi:MAG: mechanosensitive ion channel family protein [Lachnospirales bacterium]
MKIIRKIILKSFSKFSAERHSDTVASLLASLAKYAVYFIIFCNVLVMWGVNITSILALSGAVSVAIGLGAQDIVKDMMAGLFIIMENQFGVGDIVELNGFSGTVESIGIRTTRIRNVDGNVHIVPNGQISIVTNMSKGFNRAVVDVSVAYGEDIDRVFTVLKKEFKRIFNNNLIDGIIDEPQVWGINELGDSAVVIRIAADSRIGENWRIERELRKFILKKFEEENIEIPFPQVVVHSKED